MDTKLIGSIVKRLEGGVNELSGEELREIATAVFIIHDTEGKSYKVKTFMDNTLRMIRCLS